MYDNMMSPNELEQQLRLEYSDSIRVVLPDGGLSVLFIPTRDIAKEIAKILIDCNLDRISLVYNKHQNLWRIECK